MVDHFLLRLPEGRSMLLQLLVRARPLTVPVSFVSFTKPFSCLLLSPFFFLVLPLESLEVKAIHAVAPLDRQGTRLPWLNLSALVRL